MSNVKHNGKTARQQNEDVMMVDQTALEAYILAHIEPEDDYLKRLYRDTHVKLLRPRMASGHLQGRLLAMLTRMARPQNVLEIGTFTGYSALCMAEALPPGGHLYTYEINDEQEDFTRPWLENSRWSDRISFIIGDALIEAPRLAREKELTFDLVFMDGDKRSYPEYYEMLIDIVSPGGFILADNTLWDGHVVDPVYDREAQTVGVKAFNDIVAQDSRVETVILPLRDGLSIIRKK